MSSQGDAPRRKDPMRHEVDTQDDLEGCAQLLLEQKLMKSLMMAALVVQLTSAGGAGSGRTGSPSQTDDSSKDVGKHFSALKTEVGSIMQQFREARERARLEAEQRKREAEGSYEPQTQRTTAAPASPGRRAP